MRIAVIPAYNEEKHIGNVLHRTKNYVDKIIVVDDGSKDRTSEVAASYDVELIRMEVNGGKSKAMVAGIARALGYNPDVIIFVDSDGQHKPEEIPLLAEPIEQGECDVTSGYRSTKNKPLLNAIAGKMADTIIRAKDALCGFKAFNPEALKRIDLSESSHYLLETVIHDEIKRHKLRIKYVPISTIYADETSKINIKRELVSFLKYKIRYVLRKFKK